MLSLPACEQLLLQAVNSWRARARVVVVLCVYVCLWLLFATYLCNYASTKNTDYVSILVAMYVIYDCFVVAIAFPYLVGKMHYATRLHV